MAVDVISRPPEISFFSSLLDLIVRSWCRGRADVSDENLREGCAAVRCLDGIQPIAQHDPAVADHRDKVGDLHHFVQQVRRNKHRTPFMCDGAYDGAESVASNDGVEARRRLIQHKEFGPIGQREERMSSSTRIHPGRSFSSER